MCYLYVSFSVTALFAIERESLKNQLNGWCFCEGKLMSKICKLNMFIDFWLTYLARVYFPFQDYRRFNGKQLGKLLAGEIDTVLDGLISVSL